MQRPTCPISACPHGGRPRGQQRMQTFIQVASTQRLAARKLAPGSPGQRPHFSPQLWRDLLYFPTGSWYFHVQKLQDVSPCCENSRTAWRLDAEHWGWEEPSRAPLKLMRITSINENEDIKTTAIIGCLQIHISAKESVWTQSVLLQNKTSGNIMAFSPTQVWTSSAPGTTRLIKGP